MRITEKIYEELLFPRLSKYKVLVAAGDLPFILGGYSLQSISQPVFYVQEDSTGMLAVSDIVSYDRVKELDTTNYLTTYRDSNLKMPTIERAIVYTIKEDFKFMDEGFFCEALNAYIFGKNKDLAKLYEVAEFFKLPKETLDYWLNEAREYGKY